MSDHRPKAAASEQDQLDEIRRMLLRWQREAAALKARMRPGSTWTDSVLYNVECSTHERLKGIASIETIPAWDEEDDEDEPA